MRALAAALVLAAGLSAPAAGVVVRWCEAEVLSAADLTRLHELAGAPEGNHARFFARSRPEERAGLYLICGLDVAVRDLPAGTTARLSLVRRGEVQPVTVSIPLPEPRTRARELYLGLTGPDAPAEGLLAWQVELVGPDGAPLASWQSYLWSLPAPSP